MWINWNGDAGFQYPQRVDLRWNRVAQLQLPPKSLVSIPSTGRFTLEQFRIKFHVHHEIVFQYPQRVDLRWNLLRVLHAP